MKTSSIVAPRNIKREEETCECGKPLSECHCENDKRMGGCCGRGCCGH